MLYRYSCRAISFLDATAKLRSWVFPCARWSHCSDLAPILPRGFGACIRVNGGARQASIQPFQAYSRVRIDQRRSSKLFIINPSQSYLPGTTTDRTYLWCNHLLAHSLPAHIQPTAKQVHVHVAACIVVLNAHWRCLNALSLCTEQLLSSLHGCMCRCRHIQL
jgi:hypothetical protein